MSRLHRALHLTSEVRILAVGSMYPPHHLGGYELVWQAAMRRARAAGHEVRVLASHHREPRSRRGEDPDVHRELDWYWSWRAHEWRPLGPLARLRLERRNAAVLRRHLSQFRPHVVTWWAMGGMSLSLIEQVRRAGIASLLVVHDDWLVYGPRRDAWLRLWSGRRRALAPLAEVVSGIPTRFDPERAGRVLANSRHVLDRARRNGIGLADAAVVTPGIDERYLKPAGERPWRWQLLCVGRLDRQKGVDTAIAALAELPEETTLQIAGSGDDGYVEELRAQAERLGVGDRIRFLGQTSPESLPDLYAAADAVVFPVRWEEPWGLVPLEAMGIGRPVLATPRGGAMEYLRDEENTLLFPVDEPAGLAAVVRRLAEDGELRLRLREGGIRTAAAHTSERFEERIVAETEQAARRAIREEPKARPGEPARR